MAEAVYLLCSVASLVCAVLLLRSYLRNRMRLILWTSLCFVGLTANNVMLFIDLAVFPTSVDFSAARSLTALVAVCVLLYGMITADVS